MQLDYRTWSIPLDLRPFVIRATCARLAGGQPERTRELPLPGTAVILAIEHRWRAESDGAMRTFGSFAGGVSTGPATVEHTGAFDLVQLDLTPRGTRTLLGVPAAELADRIVPFEDLVDDEITERLADAPTWRMRAAILERWLRRRLAADPVDTRPDIARALLRLEATGGRLDIAALQAELNCSRRHLATRFAEEVGLGPKRYARLVRFNHAVADLRAGASPAFVAARHGFSDQPHLTRELRAFGDITPAAVTSRQDAELQAA